MNRISFNLSLVLIIALVGTAVDLPIPVLGSIVKGA